MDGFTATKIIKSINPDVKVILFSAWVFEDSVLQDRKSVFDAVVQKPCSYNELVKAVNDVMMSSSSHDSSIHPSLQPRLLILQVFDKGRNSISYFHRVTLALWDIMYARRQKSFGIERAKLWVSR